VSRFIPSSSDPHNLKVALSGLRQGLRGCQTEWAVLALNIVHLDSHGDFIVICEPRASLSSITTKQQRAFNGVREDGKGQGESFARVYREMAFLFLASAQLWDLCCNGFKDRLLIGSYEKMVSLKYF
jgi:hypothetical protein